MKIEPVDDMITGVGTGVVELHEDIGLDESCDDIGTTGVGTAAKIESDESNGGSLGSARAHGCINGRAS